jgi:antitoxin CptB
MSDAPVPAYPGRLAWRCRRGMKEIDLLLVGWLQGRYAGASAAERATFEAFLELPDPEIAGYLLGRATPNDPAYAALVAQLSPDRA